MRGSQAQRQRTQDNPLLLGNFSELSLRYLRGSLGPANKLVGRADTNQYSNGGFGGGTYNHWFQVNLLTPGWIIVTKGPPRPKYINVSVYDLNQKPMVGLPIFGADSIKTLSNGEAYSPYLDTVMQTQSDLYNTYVADRLDKGDDRYYPLGAGGYLICISTTRNEPLDYEVGLVVEFPPTEFFIGLETDDGSVLLLETDINEGNTSLVASPITVSTNIPTVSGTVNAFSYLSCEIASGATATVLASAVWLIGDIIPQYTAGNYKFLLEPGTDTYFDTIHDHSLSEWRIAWEREHQETDKFPAVFVPLTNRP